jgi:hypothetical protein
MHAGNADSRSDDEESLYNPVSGGRVNGTRGFPRFESRQ